MDRKQDQDYWRSHLDCIAREGITTKEYAEREEISVSALYMWRKRFKQQADQRARTVVSAAPRFVPVRLTSGASVPPSSPACTLILSSGMQLEMSELPSPRWLAALGAAMHREGR